MSLYGSTNDAHAMMVKTFSLVMQAHLSVLQSMLNDNAVMAHACMALAQAASAPRAVIQNGQGEPVGVQPITQE